VRWSRRIPKEKEWSAKSAQCFWPRARALGWAICGSGPQDLTAGRGPQDCAQLIQQNRPQNLEHRTWALEYRASGRRTPAIGQFGALITVK